MLDREDGYRAGLITPGVTINGDQSEEQGRRDGTLSPGITQYLDYLDSKVPKASTRRRSSSQSPRPFKVVKLADTPMADEPEDDDLKKMVAAFRAGPPRPRSSNPPPEVMKAPHDQDVSDLIATFLAGIPGQPSAHDPRFEILDYRIEMQRGRVLEYEAKSRLENESYWVRGPSLGLEWSAAIHEF